MKAAAVSGKTPVRRKRPVPDGGASPVAVPAVPRVTHPASAATGTATGATAGTATGATAGAATGTATGTAASAGPGTATRIRDGLPGEETLQAAAAFFKVFGDVTRLKILQALLRSELCVQDLAAALAASPSAVSHQLKILRLENLVKYRREGRTIFYSLSDHHVASILRQGLEHVEEKR